MFSRRHNDWFLVVGAVAALLIAGAPNRADAATESPTQQSNEAKIPASTAGEVLGWAIEVLSGRSDADFTERFAPEFVEQLPATLPQPRVVSALQAAHSGLFGGGEARLVLVSGDADATELTARVLAVASGTEYDLFIAIDPKRDLVVGLLLTPAQDNTAVPQTWEEIDAALRELPGEISVLVGAVREDTGLTEIYSITPERRLGIGSAFKLWVLGGLAELVKAGEASWDEPLALDSNLKTMPIGALAMEANRSGLNPTAEFALSRYADVMISVSDNPATDHLIKRVGRDQIIKFMSRVHQKPELNQPFLSTGEFFKLKRGAPDEVLQAYRAAETPEERQTVLDSDAFTDSVISIPLAMRWQQDGPIAIDSVEWFANGYDLARTMIELRKLEAEDGMAPLARALRINDGIRLDDEIWPSVSYKGGSEPGVLNLTFLADDAKGATWFVSLGWNNTEAALDDNAMIRIALGIFDRLADGDIPDQGINPE